MRPNMFTPGPHPKPQAFQIWRANTIKNYICVLMVTPHGVIQQTIHQDFMVKDELRFKKLSGLKRLVQFSSFNGLSSGYTYIGMLDELASDTAANLKTLEEKTA